MTKWIERKPKQKINKGNDLTSTLCNIRGIKKKEIAEFLTPQRDVLNPATEFKNAEKVAKRIKRAIENDEKIVVSVDNDADGVTATAIIIRYLRERMNKEIPYIFAQRNWGHGIKEQLSFVDGSESDDVDRNENAQRNRELVKESDLLIIVDSSSNDVKACERIVTEYETDIIILDHHEIEKNDKYMKDIGVMLVNPQQKGCRYINKSISGAGVVYKVVGLVEELFDDGLIDTEQYIDLAGVGMYADMMDMSVLENRYLVGQALLNIKNMGLERILKSAKGVNMERLNGDTIGFTIGPLINGTARMGNIQDAIELLLSDEDKEVKRIRLRMHKANEARKAMQKEMSEKFTKDIDTSGKMIFIVTDESSSGFNGLIAQDIAQKYQKPAFVGRLSKGKIMGSARSYGGIKLKTFFNNSELVEFASGHEGALGIGFKESDFEAIQEYIEENMEHIGLRERVQYYDVNIPIDEIPNSIDLIEGFNEITGINCKKIIVRVDDIMIDERKILGSNNNTVKFHTMNEIDLIKFRVDEEYGSELEIMDTISVLGELKWNVFTMFRPNYRVIKTMQIMIDDYKQED